MKIRSVFALIVDQSEILLLRRSLTTSRPGQWGLPGGSIEVNESIEEAAIRETLEESGLVVEVTSQLAISGHSVYLLCSLAEGSDRTPSISIKECMDARWCLPNTVLDLGEVMDLARLIPLLGYAGLPAPKMPNGIVSTDMKWLN